jgi:hypothetical protein
MRQKAKDFAKLYEGFTPDEIRTDLAGGDIYNIPENWFKKSYEEKMHWLFKRYRTRVTAKDPHCASKTQDKFREKLIRKRRMELSK